MRILVQNEWRNKAIFAVIILMLGSLFVSRAMLSMSMVLFIAMTTLHSGFVQQCRIFMRSALLLSISFLFLIPLISGLWSADSREWAEVMVIKLPFLLLPLAFAGNWKLASKDNRRIAVCFIVFTIAACSWSLAQYFMNAELINESYLRAKTIPTLLGDDHVRFSWMVFLAIWIAVFLAGDKNAAGRKRAFLLLAVVFLVIYLHLLAARAGLVMLYLFAFCYALHKIRTRPRLAFTVVTGIVALLLIGWFCFPTFRNRISYNLYDLSFIIKNKYRSGTSDGNRVASLKAGWALLSEHPFTGVGAGDVWHQADRWYDKNINGIQHSDKLYPSNEWLAHGCMAGWPGILFFSGVVFLPLLRRRIKNRFFWVTFHLSSICLFVVETSLEMQHGIFIYTFFSLWWWKWHCFEADY
ncbi:O-antigen ligase family protein [Terrimonas sp. NA20]|uniref:O-antigen ligase family protein n=1 Tax=Terrimonas ginsenosidimutans TaxID=2908004 RepID=A0ABS9L058_9BACT|nr:O-antigen ligase family protein [Terrimonas ginsenosidimutans]MCG2617956.1 O-antigen ligase family protein [Terrimonas ginsenosidimutans]